MNGLDSGGSSSLCLSPFQKGVRGLIGEEKRIVLDKSIDVRGVSSGFREERF